MEARRARRGTQAVARSPWRQDSAGDPAPGDVDGDTGEPGGGIGGEEERDLGDVVREAEPVQRMHGRNLLLHRGRHEPGDPLRADGRRGDRVDPYATRAD